MAIEAAPRITSRRALLAGLAGGLAAGAAGVLGRVSPSLATANYVVAGGNVDTTTQTSIHMTGGNDLNTFYAEGTGGRRGVYGVSDDNYGVRGDSVSSWGMLGLSDNSVGVVGWAWEPSENTGVMGYSGPYDTGLPPASPAKTGVFGYAAQDATSVGVLGTSTAGQGVRGTSTGSNGVAGTSGSGVASGVYGENTAGGYGTYGRSNSGAGSGVFGESTSGTGVVGASTSGIGGRFSAGVAGTALKAQGRVSFSTAGLAPVAVGTSSKTVVPGSDLVSASRILCTLESNQSGLSIQRITKDTTANTFTVYVSANVASGRYAKVAWFVIG